MRTVTRLWSWLALLGVLTLAALVGCSASSVPPAAPPSAAAASAVPPTTPAVAPTTPAGESDTAPAEEPATTALPKGLNQEDIEAGLLSATVTWKASGVLKTVSGTTQAPGKGKVLRIRVQVEKGVAVDPEKFAAFVLATLNDKRSWTENGTRRFARTDRAADAFTTVTLASPQTSADLCRPLRTFGKLSCRNGSRVVLTSYRWVKAIPEYKGDRDGYRHYVVNHEVGHALGHGHEYCAGKGKVAPLMMQQTKGLLGCRPNPWPHP
jgi:hypothetical protein